MGILRTIAKIPGQIFNFRIDKWLGFETLKNNTKFYRDQLISLFHIQKATQPEKFEEAMIRLELTEEKLQLQKERYKYLTFFYSIISLALFIYAVCLYYRGNLMGACISFALTLYSLTNVFQYHLWYFQIKQKKLGCNIREWFKATYRGKS